MLSYEGGRTGAADAERARTGAPARTAGYRRTGCTSITGGAAVVKRRSITGRFPGAPARRTRTGCTSITGAAVVKRRRLP